MAVFRPHSAIPNSPANKAANRATPSWCSSLVCSAQSDVLMWEIVMCISFSFANIDIIFKNPLRTGGFVVSQALWRKAIIHHTPLTHSRRKKYRKSSANSGGLFSLILWELTHKDRKSVVGLLLGILYARRDNAERAEHWQNKRRQKDGITPRKAEHWRNREKRWLFNENDNIDVNEMMFFAKVSVVVYNSQ